MQGLHTVQGRTLLPRTHRGYYTNCGKSHPENKLHHSKLRKNNNSKQMSLQSRAADRQRAIGGARQKEHGPRPLEHFFIINFVGYKNMLQGHLYTGRCASSIYRHPIIRLSALQRERKRRSLVPRTAPNTGLVRTPQLAAALPRTVGSCPTRTIYP